jgi:hypothetical protein
MVHCRSRGDEKKEGRKAMEIGRTICKGVYCAFEYRT